MNRKHATIITDMLFVIVYIKITVYMYYEIVKSCIFLVFTLENLASSVNLMFFR